ncbi:MAG: substrate-binding domain-containing protein [Planctomycetes bacterium]|nr:substrate-binding domain-containing protein [Planctomycetota bacterium]
MRRAFAVLLAVVVAACARDVATPAAPRVQVELSAQDDATLASALRTAGGVAAIDPAALDQARRVRAREKSAVRVFGVADTPAPQAGEALVVPGDAAAAAIDLALLACHGIALPPKVALGVRVVDETNAAAGGVLRPGPGDVGFAVLARQHAALLTTKPTTDVVFRMGLVASDGGAGWPARAFATARAAAARYPQLAVEARAGDGTNARAEAALRELLDANVRVLVVALADPAPLAAFAALAAKLRITIVAIDPCLAAAPAACVVGSDPAAIGRALGEMARAALPSDAAVVVLRRDGPAAAATAFRSALAPKPQ